VQEDKRS